jgi:hypothetical protein
LTHDEPALRSRLEWYGEQKGIVLVDRTEESLPTLKISRKRTSVLWLGEELFFHPSMALLRLLNVLRGGGDRFLQATALETGDTCIDGTMGTAADALMAAWRVGESGKVQALEASPLIAALTKEGLKDLTRSMPARTRGLKEEAWKQLSLAAERIEVLVCDHLEHLRTLENKSLDVVCFDPMFRRTRDQSAAFRPLKPWIADSPLSLDAVREARRTARRVVLKERAGSSEFGRLGFEPQPGGRYSPVAFGVINANESCAQAQSPEQFSE